jgi:ATP-dependent DNA ligase
MAAKTVTQLPVGPGWSFEPKYDGFRALAFRDDHGVHLQSRQLRDLTTCFPEVAGAVSQLDDVVLDGVVWRAGRFDFGALQDRLRSGSRRVRDLVAAAPVAFIVFDVLAHDGRDQRDRPYRKRRRKLEKLLAHGLPDGLVLTPAATDAAVARSWMLGCGTTGIEGVVAKRLDQPRPVQPVTTQTGVSGRARAASRCWEGNSSRRRMVTEIKRVVPQR